MSGAATSRLADEPLSAAEALRGEVATTLRAHDPRRHPFFAQLAERRPSRAGLEDLYLHYQAAMHATRVMGYHLPHLDRVDLRAKKLAVLADDDGIPGGDTHHYQLRRTWTELIGAPPSAMDAVFGELDELKRHLRAPVAEFVTLVQAVYPASLGAWVVVEGLAHDWIGALMHGLEPHFPDVASSVYFVENFGNRLEERHAEESLALTALVVAERPALLEPTVEDASRMARGLDALWDALAAGLDSELPAR